jgi:ABC-type multidrug transport system permease subunit
VAAAKDVRRRLADPAAFAVWIGLPLLLGGLLSFIAGGGDAPPRAQLLVVDQDATFVSGLLETAISSTEIVDLQSVTLDEGRQRIDSGDATALLVVPKGFQDAVLDLGTSNLTLITNPAQQILPGIVEESLEIAVEGVFYAQQIFGPALRRLVGGTAGQPSDADVAALSVEINQQLARLQNVVIPPAIALSVVRQSTGQGGPSLGLGQLFLPGMLFMSILFIASGMSGDVWEEQRMGTLRRALTTPQSAHRFLGGKLTAGTALIALIAAIALAAGTALFDIAWWRLPGALAWCVFVGGALLALLTLLQTFASSQRAADMLSSALVFPLMMLGGSFFPFETMPAWMASIGRWTPNGLGVARLKDLLYGDVALTSVAVAAVGIGLPAVVAFVAAGRRLRGRFAAM